MPSDRENGETPVSDTQPRGEELYYAVQQAINDWVAADEIQVRRRDGEILADEEQLVEQISIMVAIAVDEATE